MHHLQIWLQASTKHVIKNPCFYTCFLIMTNSVFRDTGQYLELRLYDSYQLVVLIAPLPQHTMNMWFSFSDVLRKIAVTTSSEQQMSHGPLTLTIECFVIVFLSEEPKFALLLI